MQPEGVGGNTSRLLTGEEEVPARGLHSAIGEPEFFVHVHPGKGRRIPLLRVGSVNEHAGDEEHHLGCRR